MPTTEYVSGLNKVVRDLEKAGVDVQDLKDTFAGIAREGAELAARYAPVRTGALRASIRGNKAKNKAVISAGKKRVPYAGPINYGWKRRNIIGSHFMQRASAQLASTAVEKVTAGLEEAIRKNDLA